MTGTAGVVFHVLNRGVRRMRLFDKPSDYEAFLHLLAKAQQRVPVRCLSYCLMPNHFHFVLRPDADGDLSRFMFWLTTTHSVRWNAWRDQTGTGHVYQGRFKAFPIYQDGHFLRVCRYVERNALRAGLVARAEHWQWSSLAQRTGVDRAVGLADWPIPRPSDWLTLVQSENAADVRDVRQSLIRNAPYGPEDWRRQMAAILGLESSMKPEGRPRHERSSPGSPEG